MPKESSPSRPRRRRDYGISERNLETDRHHGALCIGRRSGGRRENNFFLQAKPLGRIRKCRIGAHNSVFHLALGRQSLGSFLNRRGLASDYRWLRCGSDSARAASFPLRSNCQRVYFEIAHGFSCAALGHDTRRCGGCVPLALPPAQPEETHHGGKPPLR